MNRTTRHWYFRERPEGTITDKTLRLEEERSEAMPAGGFVLRTIYLSLDATNRVWLSDWDIYMDPVALGERMRGFVIGEVIESDNSEFPVGSLATGLSTWSDYITTNGEGFARFPDQLPIKLAEAFGALSVAGPTAVHGLLHVGEAKAGETVLVSAAAGAVGQIVGQIAKIQGCRTIGIAGGEAKCALLTKAYGYDAAIDYRSGDVLTQLRAAAPEGVDVLFENVGGEVLDAGLTVMNDFGRVVVCGLISSYNASEPTPGPYMFRNVIMRRLRIEGFVILDHLDRYADYQAMMVDWMGSGKLAFNVHVVEGLERAAEALNMLYAGDNTGKLMVQVGEPPSV